MEQNVTKNITAKDEILEVLQKYFSQCFDRDNNFNFEKFKTELQLQDVNFSKESYTLDWLGKSYARLLATDSATTLLKEDKEWNNKGENKTSQNLLIKGDNLEVLKHLSNAYYNKIKMIYIDPPYNTGNDDFVYQDDRKFTVEELSKLAGVDEEKAKRILDFVNSKSNSHSAWLTFMYPRLYIARRLLRDDGVIFVSIDDNEVAQLRILMDEIFGEENFVGSFVRQSKVGGGSDSKHIAKEHEYILVFSKNINYLPEMFVEHDQEYLKRYKEKDGNGRFFWDTFARPGLKNPINYDITAPDGSLINGDWIWAKSRFEEEYSKGNIRIVKKNDGQWSVQFKQYLNEKGKKPRSMTTDFGSTKDGKREILSLFDNDKVFSYPKSTTLIRKLIEFISNEQKDFIVLDFFAGSGTTGDAVMQLNAEDGGNRKYILVQIPEPIDPDKKKEAYNFVKNEIGVENPTIFEITKERLVRAARKIKEEIIDKKIAEIEIKIKELEAQSDLENNQKEIERFQKEINVLRSKDLGFKIFETTPIWEGYEFKAEVFEEQLNLFDENKLTEEDIQMLLTTWKTYDGVPLTQDLNAIDLDGYTGYYHDTKIYLMFKGFEIKHLKKLLEEIDTNKDFNPATIIVFGYNFDSKTLREIAENVSSYMNKKSIDIDFIIRY